jgi:Protein of unknown function (DUF3365)
MKNLTRFLILAGLAGIAWFIGLSYGISPPPARKDEKAKPDPKAVERARETVKMLDDLYKSAVLSITAKYVEQQSDTPAAAIAKDVFEAMHKKGWHSARLVDATGKPKNKANAARTDFEKRAAAEIKSGKPYFEELAEKDGQPVLRAATVVPAVLKQCAICHGGKEGRVLGAIVYELPIK